ncbi:hypothetical protein F5148DRAFT_1288634 [Russula earlei]|uniref:Uncharacterized protein n=1 Tax=Russula earlei TaxID=71964 RepID=A0ACC0TZ96_9AGAM|nr:hypothetical protein F5148DRAFT_1288634 [Russula earlei]
MAVTPSKKDNKASGRTSIRSDGSPLVSKPSSRAGSVTPSIKGTEGQDDGRDDVSVTESSRSHRKTEEERLQFFNSRPECREVEPHRAFCIGCDQWVPLNPVRSYAMRPWLVHRRECRRNSLTTNQVITKAPNEEEAAPDGSEGDHDVASVVQSASEITGRFKGETDRQAYLEGDPRSEEVRPYEVLCKTCKKWVQLGNKTRYSLGHWKEHQKRCSGSIPSSRVATAERKLKLVNDASAKSFTATSVQCAHCDTTVMLHGDGDYNLTKWEEHSEECLCSPQHERRTDGMPAKASDASPSRSERSENQPPLSVASTEATAVDGTALSGGTKKRGREPDEDDSETRHRARARRDLEYPSGTLDWLLLPFRSFVSGFKRGLTQSTTSKSQPPHQSTST